MYKIKKDYLVYNQIGRQNTAV